jgi:purine-nucleoside phosphorylase
MWEQVQETVSYINKINSFNPEYGIIWFGIRKFHGGHQIEFTLPYNEIPNFPVSTVQGHKRGFGFWDYW